TVLPDARRASALRPAALRGGALSVRSAVRNRIRRRAWWLDSRERGAGQTGVSQLTTQTPPPATDKTPARTHWAPSSPLTSLRIRAGGRSATLSLTSRKVLVTVCSEISSAE